MRRLVARRRVARRPVTRRFGSKALLAAREIAALGNRPLVALGGIEARAFDHRTFDHRTLDDRSIAHGTLGTRRERALAGDTFVAALGRSFPTALATAIAAA